MNIGVSLGYVKDKDHLEDVGLCGKILFKFVLKKLD
jgi:hypothetical protein